MGQAQFLSCLSYTVYMNEGIKGYQEDGAERVPMTEAEVSDLLAETSERVFSDGELERLVENMEKQPELVYEFFQNLVFSGVISELNENETKLTQRLKPILVQIEQDSGVEKLSDQVPEL